MAKCSSSNNNKTDGLKICNSLESEQAHMNETIYKELQSHIVTPIKRHKKYEEKKKKHNKKLNKRTRNTSNCTTDINSKNSYKKERPTNERQTLIG